MLDKELFFEFFNQYQKRNRWIIDTDNKEDEEKNLYYIANQNIMYNHFLLWKKWKDIEAVENQDTQINLNFNAKVK